MGDSHFSGPIYVGGKEVIDSSGNINLGASTGHRIISEQGSAALDVTSTGSTTVISSGTFTAAEGGDTFIPTRLIGEITTTLATDTTAAILTVQDASSNSTGLTLTLTDGDADGDLVLATTADGTAMTPVDLTSEDLEVAVTQAGTDSGTAAGEVKVVVEGMIIK